MTLPLLFLDRIKNILPEAYDPERWFCPPRNKAFRINTLKCRPEEVWAFLNGQGIPFEPVSWYEPAFTVSAAEGSRVLASELAETGKLYAQGLESMLPVIILDPKHGEDVLDICAAPGSKTTQIASHMANKGSIIANEHVRDRFFRLKAVTELMGAKVTLKMSDGRRFSNSILFDRILVDAPCSSEGRFVNDNPKSYAYWSPRKIHEMAHKQKGLLLSASRLLKPGGVLVYSTCTFAPEENEWVVDWLLRKTDGKLTIENIDFNQLPRHRPLSEWNDRTFDEHVEKCLRVLPGERNEGFFVAKFKSS